MNPPEPKTVIIILPDGFEEIEAITPIDLLRRAGAEVTIASREENLQVTGRNKIHLHCDRRLETLQNNNFDAIILPGGPGHKRMLADPRIPPMLERHIRAGALIAAICAAPVVLKPSGILDGKRYTAHHTVAPILPDILDEPVVVDGNLITSRGAGTALRFGLAIVGFLFGADKRDEIAASIHY